MSGEVVWLSAGLIRWVVTLKVFSHFDTIRMEKVQMWTVSRSCVKVAERAA